MVGDRFLSCSVLMVAHPCLGQALSCCSDIAKEICPAARVLAWAFKVLILPSLKQKPKSVANQNRAFASEVLYISLFLSISI